MYLGHAFYRSFRIRGSNSVQSVRTAHATLIWILDFGQGGACGVCHRGVNVG